MSQNKQNDFRELHGAKIVPAKVSKITFDNYQGASLIRFLCVGGIAQKGTGIIFEKRVSVTLWGEAADFHRKHVTPGSLLHCNGKFERKAKSKTFEGDPDPYLYSIQVRNADDIWIAASPAQVELRENGGDNEPDDDIDAVLTISVGESGDEF